MQIHFNKFECFFLLSSFFLFLIIRFGPFAVCSCRARENLPELPLSAHLLAPIQRICRYPLHLSELVKHSLSKQELIRQQHGDEDSSSNDHSIDIDTLDSKETFELALAAMKRVTEMVNEGKFYIISLRSLLLVVVFLSNFLNLFHSNSMLLFFHRKTPQ